MLLWQADHTNQQITFFSHSASCIEEALVAEKWIFVKIRLLDMLKLVILYPRTWLHWKCKNIRITASFFQVLNNNDGQISAFSNFVRSWRESWKLSEILLLSLPRRFCISLVSKGVSHLLRFGSFGEFSTILTFVWRLFIENCKRLFSYKANIFASMA